MKAAARKARASAARHARRVTRHGHRIGLHLSLTVAAELFTIAYCAAHLAVFAGVLPLRGVA